MATLWNSFFEPVLSASGTSGTGNNFLPSIDLCDTNVLWHTLSKAYFRCSDNWPTLQTISLSVGT
jgi:hypothetical protein